MLHDIMIRISQDKLNTYKVESYVRELRESMSPAHIFAYVKSTLLDSNQRRVITLYFETY